MRTGLIRAMIAVTVCLSVLPTTGVASAETYTPGAPIIGNITATASSTPGQVTVSVRFFRAGTKPSAPIQSHQLKVGSTECVMTRIVWKWESGDPGPSMWCTVDGIPANRTVRVMVRAKNQFGFGPWSTAISFRTKAGTKWKRPGS